MTRKGNESEEVARKRRYDLPMNSAGPRSDRTEDQLGPDRSFSVRSSVQTFAEFGIRSGPGLDRWTGPRTEFE